jgi:ADP-heptose:LPS heptosyltransferase
MRLLRPLGIAIEPPRLRTTLGHLAGAEMSGWMEKNCPSRPRIGLWAGGRKQERRNPLYMFAELGNRLRREMGAGLIVLWGPGEEALRDRLVRALEGAVAAPPTDLERLAALLRGLDLTITNDTGPMHLSVAVGTSTLAMFASGEPTRWGHPGPGVINLGPAASQLSPERLVSACLELLPARSG